MILSYIFQFEEIGPHGTKVIIYNLWLNDEGIYELNFDDDDEVWLTRFFFMHTFFSNIFSGSVS